MKLNHYTAKGYFPLSGYVHIHGISSVCSAAGDILSFSIVVTESGLNPELIEY
jgi:hypothetical protein